MPVSRLLRRLRRPSNDPLPQQPATERPTRTGLTVVTPSFEGHYQQFARLLDSVRTHCLDPHLLTYVVVVEEVNVPLFEGLFRADDPFSHRIVTTEETLAGFGVQEASADFLRRVGKFTFQTIKKFGALYHARTQWSLVLDSETLFLNPFSVATLVADYAERRYVFFSRTGPRGQDWQDSLGAAVLRCCTAALSVPSADRWYMEYFHWFYETDKLRDLVDHHLSSVFYRDLRTGTEQKPYFEVVLYYLYLEKVHRDRYRFTDIFDELAGFLASEIARRFVLSELPFSRFGNEYLVNMLRPEEVGALAPFFAAYRLPFLRLEPPMVSHRYIEQARTLPHFCALVSSQHLGWLDGRIAVCVGNGFAIDDEVLHAQLGELVGFLSGVECDIFVHGRVGVDEAAIGSVLKPAAARFEEEPDLDGLLEQVAPGHSEDYYRDGLRRLWSTQCCFGLMRSPSDYATVVSIRPGLVGDLSLKEILFAISENNDILPGTLYLPRALHARGVNIDLAFGPTAQMRVYAHAFSHVVAHRADHVFDAHVSLLETLVAGNVPIALAETAYSNMGDDLPGTDATHGRFHHQFAHWWGRNEELPLHQDVLPCLRAKLAAARANLRGELPGRFEARLPDDRGTVVVEAGPDHPSVRVRRREDGEAWPDEVLAVPTPSGAVLTRWRAGRREAVDEVSLAP